MVVVRESPRTQASPDKSSTQWPPKSPLDALLSSPRGRKTWEIRRDHMDNRSPSPSPTRKAPRIAETLRPKPGLSEDAGEEEDEEMLKLQLQRIEAKLKLKELQKLKQRGGERTGRALGEQNGDHSSSNSFARTLPSPVRQRTLSPLNGLEVPVSPTRNRTAAQEQLSPARLRLGLAAAPRAENISLKRARDGTQTKRTGSLRSTLADPSGGERNRPTSFNERLAKSRVNADEQQAKKERLNRIRNSGFGHLERKSSSEGRPSSKLTTDNLMGQKSGLDRAHSLKKPTKPPPTSAAASNRGVRKITQIDLSCTKSDFRTSGDHEDEDSALPGYDPFTDVHLSKRHIPHSAVAREMAGKEIYPLPRLLKEVKSPDYEPPDCESDYVIFAVLASKSEPFDQARSHRTTDQHAKDDLDAPRNKFMVLRLCDLKWEIDCYLFGTAFTQFWKLTPGTLLAILNPAILPPKGSQHNGRFSLKLGSSEDCVMEIGVARDLGYCSSIKKDGQQCGEWIDKRKTEACDFHISLLVDKQRKHRMEVNTMWRGTGNVEQARRHGGRKEGRKPDEKRAGSYHPEYGRLYTVNSGMGKSAATLLDAEDTDALHNMTQEEASRKRIASAQRERDLAAQLAEMGNGVGAEYLRASNPLSASGVASSTRHRSAAADAREALFAKPSAADLGLLSNKATDAHLSPAKDRKRHFGLGAMSMTTGGTEAMGWGGARKWGLLQPKASRLGSPEKHQTVLDASDPVRPRLTRARSPQNSVRSAGSSSPQKKRARFALPKGIREPGRESLPGEGLLFAAAGESNVDGNNRNNGDHEKDDDDDDDDELDIV